MSAKHLGACSILATLAFSALTGCATARQCPAPALSAASTAHGMRTPYRAQAADGTCLQAFEWMPSTGPVRGVVVVIHGIRDHASRYEALAEALMGQGLAVYAQDHRGHGHSGGEHQRFESIAQLVGDVDVAVQEAKRRHPGVPVFLYGHSMGGLVATHYALAHGELLRGVVLSGAALELPPSVSDGQKGAARFFSAVLPGLPAQEVDDTEFVREPAAQAEMAEDPLIDHSNLPARSAAAMLDAIEDVQRRMEEVKVPLLVLHGTADKATSVEGSRDLSQRASSSDKTLKLYEGVYHDLLHEPERELVIQDATQWILARLPAETQG